MDAESYRLPDWLGGHPVQIDRELLDGRVVIWVRDHESTLLGIQRDELVEVRPPSIDDPQPLPLTIQARDAGHWLHIEAGADDIGIVHVGYREAEWSADLVASDLRALARACWQRANAIEAVD